MGRSRLQWIIFFCFFFSGMAGLIYQTIWGRMLILTFGATVMGVSTVLTSFMAGLALGSLLFGRWIDRKGGKDALRIYGYLEIGIGVYCLAIPWMFRMLEHFYIAFYQEYNPSFSVLSLVRFLACFIVLLIPTTLMGATLPVLSKFVVSTLDNLGAYIGHLYFMNTFGAVVGSILGGFFLVPLLGVGGTIVLAAAINILIGFLAVWAGSQAVHLEAGVSAPEAQPQSRPAVPAKRYPPYVIRLVLVGFGFSGFAALIYEVAWTRVLSQVFGTTVYAFGMMLTAFLIGLALGSYLFGRYADRSRHLLFMFCALEVGAGASVLLLTPLFGYMPVLATNIFRSFWNNFWVLQFFQLLACTYLMLIPTVILGTLFPVVSKLYTDNLDGLGAKIGNAYSANTLGTIFGSFLAGFVLIPTLGTQDTIRLAAFINIMVGTVVLAVGREYKWHPALAYGCIALILAWCVGMPNWDTRLISSGVYLYANSIANEAEKRNQSVTEYMKSKEILFYQEGLFSNVSVVQIRANGETHRVLQVNGKTDASINDLTTQQIVAHLPMLLQDNPQKAALVGLASGCTLGAATLHPVRSIDCIEIEPNMGKAARFFDAYNYRCLDDPRVNMIYNDGRNFLLLTRNKYDVITSEPSNPWIHGASNLFTEQYYEICKDRLTPRGILCHWIPVYDMTVKDFKLATNTFLKVFPHTSIWTFPPMYCDAVAIGSPSELTIDYQKLKARLADPKLKGDFDKIYVSDDWSFFRGFLFSEQDLTEFCQGTPVNTDNKPLIEFSSPKNVLTNSMSETLLAVSSFRRDQQVPVYNYTRQWGDTTFYEPMRLAVSLPGWQAAGSKIMVSRDTSNFRKERFPSVRPYGLVAYRNGDQEITIRTVYEKEPDRFRFGRHRLPPLLQGDLLQEGEVRASGYPARWRLLSDGLLIRWMSRDMGLSYVIAARGMAGSPEALVKDLVARIRCQPSGSVLAQGEDTSRIR
ncbi:MAG: spermidine synthase [Armatimonadetes bacterium]|nr:spermidine synthase [Armatimonadota bacterium]